jgi:hypothetical protein
MLGRTYIDPVRCERLIEALRQYRRDWNDKLKDWTKDPLHDWTWRASMQVRIANPRAGGSAKSFLAPKPEAYFLLAATISSTILDMGVVSLVV